MKIVLLANTDWYLFNFRLSLAASLKERGYEVILVCPAGEYSARAAAQGYRVLPSYFRRRSLNPLHDFFGVFRFTNILRREGVDIIHCFTLKSAVLGGISARLAGVPVRVSSIAGLGFVFTNESILARAIRPWLRLLLKLALGGRGASVIVQNKDDHKYVIDSRLAVADSVHLIRGSGVNCDRFIPHTRRLVADKFRVLLPARVLWDKGVAEFVEAARVLMARSANVEMIIAGSPDDGNPSSVPLAQLMEWVELGWITWLGHVEDMPRLFQSVDAVCLPSYREGLPRGLIEGGAAGLPLIAADVPGCREVVLDGVDGILIRSKHAGDIVTAVERLAGNHALCSKLGAASRAKVERCFGERVINALTVDVYRAGIESAARS